MGKHLENSKKDPERVTWKKTTEILKEIGFFPGLEIPDRAEKEIKLYNNLDPDRDYLQKETLKC